MRLILILLLLIPSLSWGDIQLLRCFPTSIQTPGEEPDLFDKETKLYRAFEIDLQSNIMTSGSKTYNIKKNATEITSEAYDISYSKLLGTDILVSNVIDRVSLNMTETQFFKDNNLIIEIMKFRCEIVERQL